MQNCAGCDAEQGTINERFQKAIQDAERLAKEEDKRVAVYTAGERFEIQIIQNQPPAGTRYIAPLLRNS